MKKKKIKPKCINCDYLGFYEEASKISYGLAYFECKHDKCPTEAYKNILWGKYEKFDKTPKWCPLRK